MNGTDFGPIAVGKLMNIGGMLQRKANQLLYPFDLNQQQFSILFEIKKAGKVTQKSMVNRLVLEKAHVSKIIKKLLKMELIDVTASSADKRMSWISITPKGVETVGQCQKIIAEWNREWVAGIDENRYGIILDNLELIQKSLKDRFQNEQSD